MLKNPSVDLKMGSKACFHDGWFLNPEVSFLLTIKSLTDYGRYLTRTTGNYRLLKYVRVRSFTETVTLIIDRVRYINIQAWLPGLKFKSVFFICLTSLKGDF